MLFIAGAYKSHVTTWGILASESLTYILFTNFLLCLFSLQRWLWKIVWGVLCVSSGLADYFLSHYGVEIDRDTLTVFFQATPKDVGAFNITAILVHLIPSLLLAATGWFVIKPSRDFLSLRSRGLFVLAVLMGAVVSTGYFAWPIVGKSTPYNMVAASYDYYQYTRELEKRVKNRKNIGDDAGVFTENATQPLSIVLVIGESARADHFSLNGYKRDTNTLLAKVNNLVSFTHATSCGVMTHTSVPCLLTRATTTNWIPAETETSVISVFNALHFDTAWFGSQGDFSLSVPVSYISSEAQKKVILYATDGGRSPYDGQLLPYLDQALGTTTNHLVVLHTNGSHIQYAARYPKEFERFPADCKVDNVSLAQRMFIITNSEVQANQKFRYKTTNMLDDCASSIDTLINSYDNSIVYTDWMLNQIISRLQHTNAIMLYASDHGESLGENGKFLHGHPEEVNNWQVPMIVWASDTYIQNNPQRWAALQSYRHKPVSHDHIFHSLLDCAGIDSKLTDPSLSLCR